jgi:hypothetical protein
VQFDTTSVSGGITQRIYVGFSVWEQATFMYQQMRELRGML